MTKNTRILLLLITSTFFSCKKSKFEILLTDSSKKWVYVENLKDYPAQISYIKFEKNGNADNYNLKNNSKPINLDGKPEQGSWEYFENEKKLNIHNYYKFKVLKFNKDTIYLLDLKYKKQGFLINSIN
jgi:hypothetical protein